MKIEEPIKNYINKLSERINTALDDNNVEVAYNEMKVMNEKIDALKKKYDLLKECNSFGIANMRVESNLPSLFIKNKKAIKEYLDLISEDKNLTAQMQFIKSLEKFDSNKMDCKEYINECIEVAKKNMNLKELNKSNSKVVKFIEENDLNLDESINDDIKAMYESVHYILSNDKKFKNVIEMNENISKIADYMNGKEEYIRENKEYASIKEECLNVISSLINEDDESNGELNVLKEKILNTECTSENIDKLKDILKILKQ